MKKMRFLLAVLMMMLLASCDRTVFKYEVESENPEESYNAELILGKYHKYKNNDLFDNGNKPYRRVVHASRSDILSRFLIASDEILSNDIMYNITESGDNCSLSINDLNKYPLDKKDYKRLFDDFVKNTAIVADTTYKESYELKITDEDKFRKAKNINQTIKLTPKETVFSGNGYYQQIEKNDTIDGFVNNMRMLTNNLRTFHHVPVLHHDYSIFTETRILMKHDFYAESKSVEDVNVMLSEYGLSLLPTGEEMRVVTFSYEPVRKFLLQERGYISFGLWICLPLLVLFAIVVAIYGDAGYFETIEERDKILMPRDGRSEEEKKRLRLYSIPFFAVSLFFFVAFVIGLLKPEVRIFGDNTYANHALFFISLAIWVFSMGVSVLRWRRSCYDERGKMLRVLNYVFYELEFISICGYSVIGICDDSGEVKGLQLVFFILYIISTIAWIITVKKLKKCEVIKPEACDEG